MTSLWTGRSATVALLRPLFDVKVLSVIMKLFQYIRVVRAKDGSVAQVNISSTACYRKSRPLGISLKRFVDIVPESPQNQTEFFGPPTPNSVYAE